MGASIVQRGSNAQLLGARVDDEGVLRVLGGVSADALEEVQDDMFTLVRSLYYGWNLQDPVHPSVALNPVAAPTAGISPVGSTAATSRGNGTTPGRLHGDVTLVSASIIWDIGGDANQNATASLRFRRQGTTVWRNALELNRIDYFDEETEKSVNRLTDSTFHQARRTKFKQRSPMPTVAAHRNRQCSPHGRLPRSPIRERSSRYTTPTI